MPSPKFHLGKTTITNGLNQMALASPQLKFFIQNAMSRHIKCDWGDLNTHDKQCNDLAVQLQDGRRIISSYDLPQSIIDHIPDLQDVKIWIITYPSYTTTILLPSQY